MPAPDLKFLQVQNIIRRAQSLILNLKILGADITYAKELLDGAKVALNENDYEKALDFAKKSMIEVMRLKKESERSKPPLKEDATSTSETTGPVTSSAVPKQSIQDLKLETGFSYLVEEERADNCFKVLEKLASDAFKGLCITRSNPKQISDIYHFKNVSMLWLTDRESSAEETISPSLENMIYVAEEFLDTNTKAVILLDGIEYLISNNSFNPVLRFIRRLKDRVSETESIFLIAISPETMNEQELKLLEREITPITIPS